MVEFYSHEPSVGTVSNNKDKGNSEKRTFSFKYDADLIYSAFLQQYPAVKIKDLHWFEFRALLNGLTEECLFVKVMRFRSMKITSDMSQQEKSHYNRMKRIFALPDSRSADEKDGDFASMLFCM